MEVKPYNDLNNYIKRNYGEKLYKIALNAGMSCPNRDGTLGYGGCIFCSEGGSGEFAGNPSHTIHHQIESGKERIKHKFHNNQYIGYFQAYTNTHAPISYLRDVFFTAIHHPDIAILSIATRPDCLSAEVIALLKELSEIKPIWIELGLQTMHDKSATLIRRGYDLNCFVEAVENLSQLNIHIIVHIILGLPFESEEDLLKTINFISRQPIQGVKLQLLHILKNTDLAELYHQNIFETLDKETYIQLLIKCIERLPKDIVIHRITGDGPRNLLIAPKWSMNKREVLNQVHKEFSLQNTYQGKYA